MKESPALFSLLVSVYNEYAYLERCIDPAGDHFQTHWFAKVILVDDASTHGAAELLRPII